ncbi:MAG: hypothetical protein JWR80_10024 [Bradyrhizobium sp.]|nr:hypothetical protein [Bradyrhizobium sp.]
MADLRELLAASALITTCEKIAGSGFLPEADEQALRLVIAKACKAFEFPSIAERGPSCVIQIGDHDPEYRRTVESVAREMGT